MPDDVQYRDEHYSPEEIIRDAAFAAARLHPGSQHVDPIGQRPIDEAYDWHDLAAARITYSQIQNFLQTYKYAPAVESTRNPNSLDFASMSPAQQEIITLCRRQINDPNNTIKRVIVQGKAGTGKSAVIKAMCWMLDSDQASPEKLCQVLAPTGAAAVNIDGKT